MVSKDKNHDGNKKNLIRIKISEIKEITFQSLSYISDLLLHQVQQIDEVLNQILKILTIPFNQFKLKGLRIVINEKEYNLTDHKLFHNSYTSGIILKNRKIGFIEVCYIEENDKDLVSMIKREMNLLVESISSKLVKFIENQQNFNNLISEKNNYKMIVEKLEEGIFLEDKEGVITYVNPKLLKISGFSEEELLGKHWTFTVPPEYLAKGLNESKLCHKGISSTYESPFFKKDNTTIPIRATSTPIFTEEGEYDGVLSVFTDISQLKSTEKALRETMEKYRMLVEQMDEGVMLENTKGEITFVNAKIIKMSGYTEQEILGNHWSLLAAPESILKFEEEAEKRLLGIANTYEAEMFTKDKRSIPIIITASPMYSSEGKYDGVLSVFTDITKQKQAEEIMRKTKEKYQMIVETLEEGITLEDTNGIIVFANPKAASLVGYELKELIGKHHSLFIPQKFRSKVEHESQKRPTGASGSYETEVLSKDGKQIPILINATPIFTEDGVFDGVLTVSVDLSRIKATEEELRKSKDRYQMLIDKMEEGVVLEDTNGIFTFVNPKFSQMLNYTEEELIGKHWSVFCEPEFLQKAKSESMKRPEQIASTYEAVIIRKDRIKVPVVITASPLFSLEGKFEGVLSVFTDISELKEKDKALQEAKANYQALVENMQEGVIVTDRAGNITLINPKIEEMVGISDKNLVGKSIDTILSVKVLKTIKSAIKETSNVVLDRYESSIISVFGKVIPVNISLNTIFLHEQDFHGVLIVISDISEQKAFQRLQDQFIGSTSHELRTPTTIVKGYIDFLVKHPELHPAKREYIYRKISSNIVRLIRFIEDVHDVTKITGKVFDVFPEPVKLFDFVDVIQDQIFLLYPNSGILVNCLMDSKTNDIVKIDKERILQVVHNLVSNAIKNSPALGHIEVTIEKERKIFRISVQDYGTGIPHRYLPRLFQPFAHLDTEFSAKGSGLGLYIVRSIVVLHGGDIELHTREGYGTNFTVNIPIDAE